MTENNVAAQAGDEPMREAFEAHIRSRNPKELFVARWPDGSYKHHGTDGMWAGWQAAMASQVSPRATADVERVATECMEALAIGYVEFDEDLDENVCADCSTPTGSEWGDHAPDCLVIRARAAIATTKPGA